MTTNKTIIAIDGANLRKIVAAAAFAGTDKSLPVLTAVNLLIEDEKMTVFATDRYKLIEAPIEADILGEDRSVMIGPDAIKAMRAATAKKATEGHSFTLMIEGGTPETDKWTLTDASGVLASGGLIQGQYPAVRNLFPKTDVLAPFAARLDPGHVSALADFDRISRAEARGWAFGSTGVHKAIVAVVDDARALLMPVRRFGNVEDGEGEGRPMYAGHVIDPNASVTVKAAKTEPVDMAALRAEIAAEIRAEIAAEPAADYTVATDDGTVIAAVSHSEIAAEPAADYAALIADIPNVTEKMTARLVKALDRGDSARDAVVFATGTDKGKRSTALIAALTA